MNDKIKIAVIDTNISINHPVFIGADIKIIDIFDNVNNDVLDCGHGTAVCSIIIKECADAQITLFPIFNSSVDTIDVKKLEEVLEYINKNHKFDIINLSSGVVEIDIEDCKKVEKICKEITDKGMIIVSAYNNSGIMTYPACFDSVIGVDTSPTIRKKKDYEFIENSMINIRGYQRQQRVAWGKPNYILTGGSSFVTPYITAIIANIMKSGNNKYEGIISELKKKSTRSINIKKSKNAKNELLIKKAIIFPFNKEMHSIVKFSDELNFELVGVYDHKYFMRIGKNVSDVMNQKIDTDYILKNVENIDFNEEFDTIIVGHINEIIDAIGTEFIDKLIFKAKKYNKNLYCFDRYIFDRYFNCTLEEGKIINKCFYPRIEDENIPYEQFGKMWVTSTPILGVFGTRSKQGKFTAQMLLKKKLKLLGYEVKSIISEPTGWLFGADAVYPFGYSNTINVDYNDSILILNSMLHDMEMSGSDIIIVGSQSGTIPYDFYASSRITMAQTAFLYGTLPDAVVLCICPDDEEDYIRRTIKYIESSCKATVIGLIMFPIITELFAGSLMKNTNISNSDKLKERIKNIEGEFGIPCFELCDEGIEKQVTNILEFFS